MKSTIKLKLIDLKESNISYLKTTKGKLGYELKCTHFSIADIPYLLKNAPKSGQKVNLPAIIINKFLYNLKIGILAVNAAYILDFDLKDKLNKHLTIEQIETIKEDLRKEAILLWVSPSGGFKAVIAVNLCLPEFNFDSIEKPDEKHYRSLKYDTKKEYLNSFKKQPELRQYTDNYIGTYKRLTKQLNEKYNCNFDDAQGRIEQKCYLKRPAKIPEINYDFKVFDIPEADAIPEPIPERKTAIHTNNKATDNKATDKQINSIEDKDVAAWLNKILSNAIDEIKTDSNNHSILLKKSINLGYYIGVDLLDRDEVKNILEQVSKAHYVSKGEAIPDTINTTIEAGFDYATPKTFIEVKAEIAGKKETKEHNTNYSNLDFKSYANIQTVFIDKYITEKQALNVLESANDTLTTAMPGAGKTTAFFNAIKKFLEMYLHKKVLWLSPYMTTALKDFLKANKSNDNVSYFNDNYEIKNFTIAVFDQTRYNLPVEKFDIVVVDEMDVLICESGLRNTMKYVYSNLANCGKIIGITATPESLLTQFEYVIEYTHRIPKQKSKLTHVYTDNINSCILKYKSKDGRTLIFNNNTPTSLGIVDARRGAVICSKNNDNFENSNKEIYEDIIKDKGLPSHVTEAYLTDVTNRSINLKDIDRILITGTNAYDLSKIIQSNRSRNTAPDIYLIHSNKETKEWQDENEYEINNFEITDFKAFINKLASYAFTKVEALNEVIKAHDCLMPKAKISVSIPTISKRDNFIFFDEDEQKYKVALTDIFAYIEGVRNKKLKHDEEAMKHVYSNYFELKEEIQEIFKTKLIVEKVKPDHEAIQIKIINHTETVEEASTPVHKKWRDAQTQLSKYSINKQIDDFKTLKDFDKFMKKVYFCFALLFLTKLNKIDNNRAQKYFDLQNAIEENKQYTYKEREKLYRTHVLKRRHKIGYDKVNETFDMLFFTSHKGDGGNGKYKTYNNKVDLYDNIDKSVVWARYNLIKNASKIELANLLYSHLH